MLHVLRYIKYHRYVNHKENSPHILEIPNMTSEQNILLPSYSPNKTYFMELDK